MRQMQFINLVKDQQILKAVSELEWEDPTPIQERAIPLAAEGIDLMAQAQTGTGKTGAFAIPIIGKLEKKGGIQCLVLVPTRELAVQVAEDFGDLSKFTGHRAVAIYGGQSINVQVGKLRKGVECVVGTPGRLMDLMRRGELNFDRVRFVVLDEADRMLDMGFIDDIEWILRRVPKKRQTMLFSATLPEQIRDLAKRYMKNPREVIVSQDTLTVPQTEQVYINVGRKNKMWALCRILDDEKPTRAMIFCSTKRMVDILTGKLKGYGYAAEGLHGDLTQAQRDKVMARFRAGKAKILIATDVAARGLDIEDVSHVINYDIPENPEDYIHRIGRTARAGKDGRAITFVAKEEQHLVKAIEDFGRTHIEEDDVPDSKGRDTVKRRLDLDEFADLFGMVAFELNLGRSDGIDMTSLLRFMERKSGIRENLVGTIEIEDRTTMIEVHKSVAFRAMKDMPRLRLGGKKVDLKIIRDRGRR
ncbi:MAG: DEAD/DEAH box helicase [Methanobacteriota archaeon]|nr:MAG: DEAD/DEAH box helicase [Euryarchaeota archaeon]